MPRKWVIFGQKYSFKQQLTPNQPKKCCSKRSFCPSEQKRGDIKQALRESQVKKDLIVITQLVLDGKRLTSLRDQTSRKEVNQKTFRIIDSLIVKAKATLPIICNNPNSQRSSTVVWQSLVKTRLLTAIYPSPLVKRVELLQGISRSASSTITKE